MSLEGEMMRARSDIQNGIRQIIQQAMTDRNGVIKGTQRIWGYVCALHLDPSAENYGTVDVQEYMCDNEVAGVGFHKDVYLSALPNNENGTLYMPELYSDVLIAQDPHTKIEYVVMFSHLKAIQLRSHETAEIGVTETEPFQEGGEVDVHELKPTGLYTKTTYDKDQIINDVQGVVSTTMNKDKINHNVQDSSTMNMDKDKIVHDVQGSGKTTITKDNITHDVQGSKVQVSKDKIVQEVGGQKVTVNNSKIMHGNGSEHMIKGDTLGQLLGQLIDAICQITVGTSMGPSTPPVNAAAFVAIKAQLQTMYSQISYLD